ncbi:MAG: hypothetical protein ACJA1A_001146 [Saprospiraceae bacterium]|jgi:hypothetical protein
MSSIGNFQIKIITVFIIFLGATGLNAQESSLGNWLIYIGNKKVDSKWNIHHEVQYRNYNAIGDLEQLLLRTGIGYNLTENGNNLLLGYGYIHSENYLDQSEEKVSIGEHRIFQQFITKQKVGKVSLQHRYRFEQRFVAEDVKLRFRYFLGINVPLVNLNVGSNPLYLSIYNEIFINSVGNIFDRNRLYGGIGYKINDNLKMEIGYMNQFLNQKSRDQINVIAFVNF